VSENEVLAAPSAQTDAASNAAPTPQGKTKDMPCVNVMARLVDESAEKYINMFGLCTCSKCVSDVKALALNNLPPKYVVMEEREIGPRTTLYEGRFRTAVTAQILRACQTVMEQPRHNQ
jgi:hypothetical protein